MNPMKVVIVGGVATGPKVGARLRRLMPDADITVIEKNEYISYGGCGLPLFVGNVVKGINDLMSTTTGAIRNPEYFLNVKNFKVLSGTVVEEIDRANKEIVIYKNSEGSDAKRERLSYDKLVLATGGEAVYPPIPGLDLPGVHVLQKPQDGLAIKEGIATGAKNIVVIGGGLIGLEAVEAFADPKRTVTVIERENALLGNMLDEDLAPLVKDLLEDNMVDVLLGETVTEIQEQANTDGSKSLIVKTNNDELEADLVLLAVGVKPNSKLAQACGLEVGVTGGIKVDEYLTTSDPDIYSGGDCAEKIHRVSNKPVHVPLASIANKQGRVIANNIAGLNEKFPGVVGTTACQLFEFNIGKTGLSEAEARNAGFNPVAGIVSGLDATHYHPSHNSGSIKLIADAESGKLLGAQAVGNGDVIKRIDVIAATIAMNGTIYDLKHMDLAYAPVFATAIDLVIHAASALENVKDELVDVVMPSVLAELIESDKDFVVLDVRSGKEVKGNPKDDERVINIPLSELRGRLDELPKDKEIITACPLGVRAYEAYRILKGAGFSGVKSIAGGFKTLPYDVM